MEAGQEAERLHLEKPAMISLEGATHLAPRPAAWGAPGWVPATQAITGVQETAALQLQAPTEHTTLFSSWYNTAHETQEVQLQGT